MSSLISEAHGVKKGKAYSYLTVVILLFLSEFIRIHRGISTGIGLIHNAVSSPPSRFCCQGPRQDRGQKATKHGLRHEENSFHPPTLKCKSARGVLGRLNPPDVETQNGRAPMTQAQEGAIARAVNFASDEPTSGRSDADCEVLDWERAVFSTLIHLSEIAQCNILVRAGFPPLVQHQPSSHAAPFRPPFLPPQQTSSHTAGFQPVLSQSPNRPHRNATVRDEAGRH
jgi:hypothetical protein